jgi:hypothetical protein
MHIQLRRSFAILIAVAFAASGIFSQTCLAVQPSEARAIGAPNSHADLHQLHSTSAKSHHDHQITANAPPANSDPQPVNDHSSTKCCSLCLISGIAPATLTAVTIFTTSTISFALASREFLGHTIPIDPGIPKSIV